MMNEFINKYRTHSFIHGEIFMNYENTILSFPQLQGFVGTSCQLYENNIIVNLAILLIHELLVL